VSDFSFEDLSPALILDAIESLGIYVTSGLLALNSYENRVYQFKTEEHGRLVVKFYRPQRLTNAQIQEEHDFAFELQSYELPVVAPSKFDLSNPNVAAASIEQSSSLFFYQGYRFALFPSVGGRQFEVDNLDQLEITARLIGRMHATSAKKPFKHRFSINVEEFLTQPIEVLKQSVLVPQHLHLPFFTIIEMVAKKAQELYMQASKKLNIIRLHGDCHPGNILWHEGPMFVDLDDCRSGPAIQDLWMLLAGDYQQQQIQLETVIEAYEEFNSFDTAELALIEPLRAMRMVHYMAWLSKRWVDPAFPRAFPWFGEDRYWENQILALKEQMSALQQPIMKLQPF
jgi:Ser/Thr protein kinase RdoA (MazF antagonist)